MALRWTSLCSCCAETHLTVLCCLIHDRADTGTDTGTDEGTDVDSDDSLGQLPDYAPSPEQTRCTPGSLRCMHASQGNFGTLRDIV